MLKRGPADGAPHRAWSRRAASPTTLPALGSVGDARLDRFEADWDRWMRGDLPIKDDVDVTADDIRRYHLVLFGDPGSNKLLAELLPDLPVSWTRERVGFVDPASAEDHAPALIAPNPRNLVRYVVVNSGHTFGADAFRGTNALLFPRLGDYGVFGLREGGEEVVASGDFDEAWKPKAD